MARVFVLDDDDDLRFLLSTVFEQFGAEKCLAFASLNDLRANAESALHCDLAVLDVNLGNGKPTGLDALAWLTENHFRGRIAFLTGHARANPDLLTAVENNGVQIYEKPITVEKLQQMFEGER